MIVKVNGTNFVRETTSMAIMPVDDSEKRDYISKVNFLKTQKKEINSIKNEVSTIKNDMSEIRMMLQQLLEKDNNGKHS